MTEELFEIPSEYDAMLARGLSLSGESREYFVAGRLAALERSLPVDFRPQRVFDFGCGTGETTVELSRRYAGASVVGVDTSVPTLVEARRRSVGARVTFALPSELTRAEKFDLCYTNGVFHHIEVAARVHAAAWIRDHLNADGRFALFENNPWNPGARWVMRRIAFDRDAVMLSPREASRILRAAGFAPAASLRSLFWFPRRLSWLRVLERALARVPLGAQYLLLARN